MRKNTKFKIIYLSIITTVIVNLFLCAAVKGETGDIKKGKLLFNDPKISNSLTGDSCNTCHYNGNGLEKSGKKNEFTLRGGNVKGIEVVVNICIDNYMMGNKLNINGKDMADIVAYIKSFDEITAEPEKTNNKESVPEPKTVKKEEPVPEPKTVKKEEPASEPQKTNKKEMVSESKKANNQEPYSNYIEEYRKRKAKGSK